MKYILFIATDPAGETTKENADAWVQKWNARGVRLEGMPLRHPRDAKIVRRRGGEVHVTDGPYPHTAEWIAGYDLIDCAGLDEAIEVAGGHPMASAGRIEVRHLSPLDLGPGTQNPPHEGDTPASRFLALFRADPTAEPYGHDPGDLAACVKDGLGSGRYLGGEHLRPVEEAKLVRRRDGQLLVTDEPYSHVHEWVGGVAFIDGDWEQAIEYVSRAPMARSGLVELREFWTDV